MPDQIEAAVTRDAQLPNHEASLGHIEGTNHRTHGPIFIRAVEPQVGLEVQLPVGKEALMTNPEMTEAGANTELLGLWHVLHQRLHHKCHHMVMVSETSPPPIVNARRFNNAVPAGDPLILSRRPDGPHPIVVLAPVHQVDNLYVINTWMVPELGLRTTLEQNW